MLLTNVKKLEILRINFKIFFGELKMKMLEVGLVVGFIFGIPTAIISFFNYNFDNNTFNYESVLAQKKKLI